MDILKTMFGATIGKIFTGSIVVALVLAGCSKDESDARSASTRAGAEVSTTGTTEATSTTQPVSQVKLACANLQVTSNGTLQNEALTELSGLAVSQQYEDVFWAHNDSGSQTGIYALDSTGKDLGFFPLNIRGVDIEAISINGGKIYLADIGNNVTNVTSRDATTIYEFEEPNPTNPSAIGSPKVHYVTYPDGDHDAEAFFVDPTSEDFYIIEKPVGLGSLLGNISDASIYTASSNQSGTRETPQVMKKVGTIPLGDLADATKAPEPEGLAKDLGITGLVTAADIHPDGSVLVARTYATVWIFERKPQQSITEALQEPVCEAPTNLERQGEAIALLPQANAELEFITISEGQKAAVNITE